MSRPTNSYNMQQPKGLLAYFVCAFSLIWLLAVYKVMVMNDDDSKMKSESTSKTVKLFGMILSEGKKEYYRKNFDNNINPPSTVSKTAPKIPITAEWLYIRSSKDYKVESKDFVKESVQLVPHNPVLPKSTVPSTHAVVKEAAFQEVAVMASNDVKKSQERENKVAYIPMRPQSTVASTRTVVENEAVVPSNGLKKAHELHWPPVLPDGSIAGDEGEDVMPLIGLKVPRFWEAPPGSSDADINRIGRKVNGQETIFLMIASYRDFQCRETITSAFMRSDHPERLFIGAVDQTVPGDIGCLDIEIPCSQDSSQPICKYRSQISIYHMDAKFATGPVTARHVGDRMYRGESFVMQMDAHCQFVRHWDTKIVQQWKETGNEMAVLSTYLTDVQGSITSEGDSTRNTIPLMCNSDFEGAMPARYLRHGSQPEDIPTIKDMPQLQPFWAAGFSFSRGHFKVRVPYDAYQPMVFQGEEIAIGIRGFTFGYDFYAPRESVVFHEYAERSSRRKKIHMFWENSAHAGEGQRSIKRGTAIIGMAPDLDPNSWDHSEMDKYGIGHVRDLQLFYKLFLIDPFKRKAVQLCPFAKTAIMHRDFQPYLKPDGAGIDYSELMDYNTKYVLDNNIGRQHPLWERKILNGIELKGKDSLQHAVDVAVKFGLDKKNPTLINSAREILKKL